MAQGILSCGDMTQGTNKRHAYENVQVCGRAHTELISTGILDGSTFNGLIVLRNDIGFSILMTL